MKEESQRSVDDYLGRWLNEKHRKDKRLCGMEVKDGRELGINICSEVNKVKGVDGGMLQKDD